MGRIKGQLHGLTDEVRLKLEEAAALDCSIEEMACWADVSRASIYNWLKADTEWAEKIDKLRNKPFLKARNTVIKSLDDPKNAQWYLERKKKSEFAQRNEMTGKDGDNLVPSHITVEAAKLVKEYEDKLRKENEK